MRMFKTFFVVLFTIIFFSACNDDEGYSLDKFYVEMATVVNPNLNTAFFLQLDDNVLLWTAASNYYNYIPKDGQRIIANYTLLWDKTETGKYDFDVKLNSAYNVLTKGIFDVTPNTNDSIGNDSIVIDQMWIGSDYLNVEFIYPGYSKVHYINLVNDASKFYNDGKLHLEFRHNANGDSPIYSKKGIVSFNLKAIKDTLTSNERELAIHVNIPNQTTDKVYSLKYTLNKNLQQYQTTKPRNVEDGIQNKIE